MLDGTAMYPRGFHPALHTWTPSLQRKVKGLRRNQVSRVKYYFIDWGLSSQFDENDKKRLVYGSIGADQEVPELFYDGPYNPCPVDVFTLGNVFKWEYVNVSYASRHHRFFALRRFGERLSPYREIPKL